MTIQTKRAAFDKATAFALSCVERRVTVPVLAGLAIRANGRLSFSGTDLDMVTTADIDYDGRGVEGFVVAGPTNMRDAVRHGGGEDITIGAPDKDGRFDIASGSLTVKGRSLGDPVDNIDLADTHFETEVGSGFFDQMARVSGAISTEETRYHLNGIYAHHVADWGYRLVATDGHRLYVAEVPLPTATGQLASGVIIPRRVVALLAKHFARSKEAVKLRIGSGTNGNKRGSKLDTDVKPKSGNTRIAFEVARPGITQRLTSRLIDGTFPDYSRVIPTANDKVAVFATADLRRAINAVASIGTEKIRAVKIVLAADSVVLSVASPENGDATIKLACQHKEREFKIVFNGRYLIDALDACGGDETRIIFADSAAPTIIENPADTSFRAVLMPVRLAA